MQNNQTSLPLIAAGDPLAQFFLPEDPCLPWWIATTVTLLALGFLWSRLLRMRLRLKSARQHSWNLQAVIIHEIRTPFCAISKLLELATQTHQLQTNTRELLTTAHHSARSLLVLMDDMLTQSKLETGKLVLTPQTVNLPALLNELARSYTPIATQKNLKFIIDVDCNPSSLKIDVLRLRQILSNILSNAIKFTRGAKFISKSKAGPPISQASPGSRFRSVTPELACRAKRWVSCSPCLAQRGKPAVSSMAATDWGSISVTSSHV